MESNATAGKRRTCPAGVSAATTTMQQLASTSNIPAAGRAIDDTLSAT
jgi:hypothetical protein